MYQHFIFTCAQGLPPQKEVGVSVLDSVNKILQRGRRMRMRNVPGKSSQSGFPDVDGNFSKIQKQVDRALATQQDLEEARRSSSSEFMP